MAQTASGPAGSSRLESAVPVSADWADIEDAQILALDPWTHGLVPTGGYVVSHGGTLVPAGDDVRVQLLGPALTPMKGTSSHALQEWEGVVVEVGEDEFVARLVDVTSGPNDSGPDWLEDEEAVVPFSVIDEDDRKRLSEGSVFRWVISHQYTPSGSLSRISKIVFRDLPAIMSWDITRGEEWADRMSETTPD